MSHAYEKIVFDWTEDGRYLIGEGIYDIIVHYVWELFTSPTNEALFSIDLLICVVGNN